jgi:DNA-binding XRE family transcriptional regulator
MEKNQLINQHITDDELQRKQKMAVELIANGKTDMEVAKEIGVTRQTVNEWKNHDVEFQLELQVRRREVVSGLRDKMNEMVMTSMEIIKKSLVSKNPKVQLSVALQVLKIATRLGVGKEETEKEFKEKDRKFTMVLMHEALKGLEQERLTEGGEGKGKNIELN